MPLHTPSLAAAAAVIALLLALSVWLASWRPRRDALPATGLGLLASAAAFACAAGVGLIHDKTAAGKSNTYYAAYSFPLFGVKGATITPAISHSTHTGQDGLTAVRVRLNYAF